MLTQHQIDEAIAQMKVSCELKMADYEMVAARGLLYELGYETEQADQVIEHLAAGGFTNCLDPSVPVKAYPDFTPTYPTEDVCYWGPDQMKSRLDSLMFFEREEAR